MLGLDLVWFLVSCLGLVISASLLVKSLSKLAAFLRLSEFVVAFILMAFATSVPELFVGISSGLRGEGALALGTVIGSNIANLSLVIGVSVLLAKGIKIESVKIKRDSLYMILIMLLPAVLMVIGGVLSRIDALILILVFVFYVYRKLGERKEFRKVVEDSIPRKDVVFSAFLFVFCVVVLFFSSGYVVEYASLLALGFGLPVIFIGLFLVALGTSLPELVFGSKAALEGHGDMNLGNLIGSVVVNSTLVLAVTALISPISADFLVFFVSAIFMIIVGFLFFTFVKSGDGLDWREGLSLIFLYVFFLMVEFYLKSYIG